MHGCQGGMCGCQGEHAWLQGGMRGCHGGCVVARGHVWLPGGVCGCQGACVVARGACVVAGGGGMHGCWGGMHWIQRDTVNERAVRILLECILVQKTCTQKFSLNGGERSLNSLNSLD